MEIFYEQEKNNVFMYNLKRFFANLFKKSILLEANNSSSIMQKLRLWDETGEDFILNTDDIIMEINNYDKTLESEKDLILVYATNIAPTDNKILTPSDLSEKYYGEVKFQYERYGISLSKEFHNSIHFCMNSYFSSEKCKYAVCIPLKHFNGKIYGGTECDLFTDGAVTLDKNAYVLCPEKEVNTLRSKNNKAKVVGFKGNNACIYINKFINLGLGYKYKEPDVNEKEWRRDTQDKEFIYKVFENNKWFIGNFEDTPLLIEENRKECTEKIIQTMLLIKDNNLIKEDEKTVRKILTNLFECGNKNVGYSFLIDYSLNRDFNTSFNNAVKKQTGVRLQGIQKWKKTYSIDTQQDLKQLLCERTMDELI